MGVAGFQQCLLGGKSAKQVAVADVGVLGNFDGRDVQAILGKAPNRRLDDAGGGGTKMKHGSSRA